RRPVVPKRINFHTANSHISEGRHSIGKGSSAFCRLSSIFCTNLQGLLLLSVTMKALIAIFCLFALSAAAEEPSLKDFQRKPYVISNEEVQQIKEEIRTQCHLPQAQ